MKMNRCAAQCHGDCHSMDRRRFLQAAAGVALAPALLGGCATLKYSKTSLIELIDFAGNEKPILNTAGEPLDPPVMKEYKDLVMQFQFWRKYDFKTMARLNADYIDSVNWDTFYGFPGGTVKCTSIQAEEQQVGPYRYWQITMEFTVRGKWNPDGTPVKLLTGWLRRFLNQGFRTLTYDTNGNVTGFVQITDDSGKMISKPAKLSGTGLEMSEGADPWFIYVRDFEYRRFSLLNLE